jgi:hypothetical protein
MRDRHRCFTRLRSELNASCRPSPLCHELKVTYALIAMLWGRVNCARHCGIDEQLVIAYVLQKLKSSISLLAAHYANVYPDVMYMRTVSAV